MIWPERRESLTKCIWVGRSEVWQGDQVQWKRHRFMIWPSTPHPRVWSVRSEGYTLLHSHTHTHTHGHMAHNRFQARYHPPSFIPPVENPIYTLHFYWSLNFISAVMTGLIYFWARAKSCLSTHFDYAINEQVIRCHMIKYERKGFASSNPLSYIVTTLCKNNSRKK